MTDRYTDGTYAAHHPTWHAEDAAAKAAAIADLVAHVGWMPGRVVDLGCGTGDVLRHLAERWPQAELDGWDPAPEALARAVPHPRVRLHQGDGGGARGDLALSLDVAEHTVDDVATLRALRAVAPRQVVRLPLDVSVWDRLRGDRLRRAREVYGHRHVYTRRSARALLRRSGLRVVATRFDRVPPPVDTPRRALVDAVRRGLFRGAPRLTVDLIGGWSLLAACEG